MVTSNLKQIRSCCNIGVYLSINTVSKGHIICSITGIPFGTKVRTCTCYGEGCLAVASCAKVICIIGVTESRNYRVTTLCTNLIGCTGCLRTGNVITCRAKSAPCSTAIVPSIFLNGIVIRTTCRNNKVSCLIPLIVPVVSRRRGIHSAEDNVRIYLIGRNLNLVYAVSVGVGHTNPSFAIAEEVSSETCIIYLPICIGGKIEILGLTCSTGKECCHAHQECENYKKSDKNFACVSHKIVSFLHFIFVHAKHIISYLEIFYNILLEKVNFLSILHNSQLC